MQSLTAINCDVAVAILKRTFGNKQLIINRRMETLLNINSVKSGLTSNIQPLRPLYDQIESQVRTLRSSGVSTNSYGSLLYGEPSIPTFPYKPWRKKVGSARRVTRLAGSRTDG